MGRYRALLTENDRAILRGERDVSDDKRYQSVSRARNRIEALGEDLELLAEHRPDLIEELQNRHDVRSHICED